MTNHIATSALTAWPFAGNFSGAANHDGMIYFPCDREAEVPSSGNYRAVCYRLLDLFGVGSTWFFQQMDILKEREDATTFASWGTFKGDEKGSCGESVFTTSASNAANAPWGWDDQNDGSVFAGEMALDPANLVDRYFDSLGSFSRQYLRNDYLETLQEQGFGGDFLPRSWPEQLDLDALYARRTQSCSS